MGTIVQKYGPIYGEAVNGTVQGRPNGSVFVPLSNVITFSLVEEYRYMKYTDATHLRYCNSSGVQIPYGDGGPAVAVSQDLSSNIVVSVYSDEELTTKVAGVTYAAGLFNLTTRSFSGAAAGLTDGQTVYVRAQLLNNSTPVATSEVIPCVMVVTE